MPFVQTPLVENNFDIRLSDSLYESRQNRCVDLPNYKVNENGLNLSNILNSETYIHLLRKMETELQNSIDYYDPRNDIRTLQEKFAKVLPKIFQLNPEQINSELTYNRSIIFTILVRNTIYYLESFFDAKDLDDEGIFSTFDKSKGVKSFAGSMKEVFDLLSLEISFNSLHTNALAVNA